MKLKAKIALIIAALAVALIFFSFSFVLSKYDELNKSASELLYITALLWIFLLFALGVLGYVLRAFLRKDDNGTTTNYIAHFLDITDLKKVQNRVKHQADHDFLTGALDRRSLISRLNEAFIEAQKNNQLHAYLFIDLDEFKSINDKYGHDAGDKLLVEIVARIRPLLDKDDILARMSGDEFSVILKNIDRYSSDGIRRINEICVKITSEISRTFTINRYKINTSASIGARIFPDDIGDVSDVITHADAAMYQVKNGSKNNFLLYDQQLAHEIKASSVLKDQLERACENGEFIFFFQPKVDTYTDKIKGVEILVRWQHPTKGLLLPSNFLDTALETGLLPKITALSILAACDFLESTKKYYNGTVAINISSAEISDPFFISNLVSTVGKYGIDTSRVELEITEDELIKNFNLAIIMIKKLQSLGICISIDDFGTGYSSITYLQKLPVDTLKIDRSFIKDIDTGQDADRNRVLVQTITDMAKILDIKVVAEGVESQSQLSVVKELGIEQYQGFLFSKAVDQKRFIEILKDNRDKNPTSH